MKDDEEKLSGEGFITETHNPPSLIPSGGIHIQVGEDIIPHRDLEEVLKDLFIDPHTGIGGCVRDERSFEPIDYGKETRPNPCDMVVQIGGVTSPEVFGKDSHPKDFPSGVGEHCRHIVFGAGGSRLINTLKEIVPNLKKKK